MKVNGSPGQCLNPGNLRTELSSNLGFWLTILTKILVHPPIYGAYTELFAGLSPEITIEKTGVWGTFRAFHSILTRPLLI